MTRTVPALVRAFQLLDIVATHPDGLTPVQLSTMSGLPRSSSYELMNSLEHLGCITRSKDDGRIRLGLHLFELGSAYARSLDITREGQRRAADLAAAVHETVQVAILDGKDSVVIAKVDGDRAVRMVSYVGSRTPAHCTGVGKAMLAHMSDSEVKARVGDGPLLQMTARSIPTADALLDELHRVRERGWSIDDCESNVDVSCIAVPIFDAAGHVSAAMSISAPAPSMTDARRSELLPSLQSSASDLSRYLGYSLSN